MYTVPDLEPAIYLRTPGPSGGEGFVGTTFWLTRAPCAAGLLIVSRLFQWVKLGKIDRVIYELTLIFLIQIQGSRIFS